MKILGGGLQVPMAEQDLNRAKVRSRLEQMGGPAMAAGLGILHHLSESIHSKDNRP
jgi:hypothetical protein